MKQYNKTNCPDVILYKGEEYKMNIEATHLNREGIKLSNKYHIKVNVLSRNLKGKTDLHGNPYKASVFIYSNQLGMIPHKTVDMRPSAVKELNRIKKFGYGV